MAKKDDGGIFVYQVVIPELAAGQPSWIELPFLAPLRVDRWRDRFTPAYGLHSIRFYGPQTVYDRTGAARTLPGEYFATRRPIGQHLLQDYSKRVTRSSWQGSGRPNTDRYVMSKDVAHKCVEVPADDVPLVMAQARYPAGENFRGIGRPFGTDKATWHESLFVDQRRDADISAEVLALRKNMAAQLEGVANEDAVETAERSAR